MWTRDGSHLIIASIEQASDIVMFDLVSGK